MERKFQGEKSVAFHLEPQLQGVKTSPLAIGLQEPQTFNLTSEPEPQGITTEELNKEPKAESVRSIQWIPLQKFNDMMFLRSRSGSPFQSVKCTEQKPSIKLGGGKPSGMTQGPKFQGKKSGDSNLRPQEQCVKTLQLSPGPELQKGGNFASSSEPHSQFLETMSLHHGPQVVRSSDLVSQIYNVVPSGLKTRNQKQNGKPHKLSQNSQLQSMKSTVFNHESSLQQIKSSDLCTKLRDLKSMEFNSEQQLQDVKSSELGLGTGTQSLGFNPGPQLQEIEPSAVSTEVKLLQESPQEFKHEPRLQCRKFRDWSHSKNIMASNTGIQDVESSELHPCPDLQGIKSKVFCPGSHLEDVNSACTPNINSQYVNSSGYMLGPYLQDMNSSACIAEPNTQCINSECNVGRHLHGLNSSSCFSGSKLQCVDSTGSNPESHLQDINSTKCTPEPSPPCVNSPECNPEPHLQGVNSIYILWQNPLYENSNRYNPGPLFQGMNFCSFPPPQTLCVNPVLCNPRIYLQDRNSSTCTLSQESQSVNSMGYNPGAHLQAPKLQEQNLKDLKSEFTPGSNNLGVAPIECNPGPQLQDMHSGFNPESKPQCISSVKPSSGPKLKNIKFFELTPGSESQSTKSSVGLNSGSPSQDGNSSNLMLGAKFQRILSKNQLGSWQQSEQSIFTWKPQSNGVNSVVLPASPLEDRKFPQKITQASFCTDTVKLTPDCGLNDLRSKVFSPESYFQKFQGAQLKLASQSQSVSDAELMSCHSSQHPLSSLAPKPCFQDTTSRQLRIGSEQQSLNCELFPLEKTPMMVLAPQSNRKLSAGPALTSVKLSSLSLKTQPKNTKSLAFASETKWQGAKQVKLSSVSLSETGKSVVLSPKSILQNVKPGNLMPHTTDPVTESTKRIYRSERQVLDFAKMIMKPRYQVPKSVDFTSAPIFQDVGSLVMTKGLEHKSTEMMEKSMRLSSNPIDDVIESSEMPTKLNLQLPEFFDLTPTLSDLDSKSSESHLQKSDQIPEAPELHSWSGPEFQDFKNLQIKEVTESDRITINFKNHVVDTIELTCEARLQGKEFLRVTSKPVNRETGFIENSPRPCPQDLGPLGVGSKKKSQREQSLVSTPRPFCHVPHSASGITPESGPQILKSKNLTSMLWQQKESSELSVKQTSQVVENRDSVELTFGTEQPGGIVAKLTKPQNLSLENASITPIESPDQTINLVGISLKQEDQVTESEKTQLSFSQSVALPKVSESVEVIPRPPVQTIKSVNIPKSILQKSKCIDLTPRIHDVISSEFSPSLWLQNVQSKKLIIEPTHKILETKRQPGFQIIKTLLIPKPLLLIAKSEEVAPGPCPQVVESIRLSTRSSIKVKECLNLHPKPHLQDLVRPMELSPKADIQVTSAELIFQQTSLLKEPPVLSHEQRLQARKSLGLKTVSSKLMKIKDPNQGSLCQKKDPEMITSAKLEGENYISRFIHNPSIPFLSSVDKTTELGPLQGSGVPEVSRAFGMENFGVGILQSSKSYTNPLRIKSSVLPLVLQNLPSDKAGDTKGTPYPEIWSMNVFSKEESEKEKMEEFQRYSSYSFRFLSEEFQAGLGTRRSSLRSFLGIQQNVWESRVCRQRLPRRYLSNMLMLGNVLGTTMERKPCSQSFLTEGSTMDIRQSIQNLFGIPAELMAFSQSLLERVPKTMSQTSVVKNYIQRHTLSHSNEKRMPLKMWTRGSTSSIIQQYSGTRLGAKKISSKLSDIFPEVTEHVTVSCSGAQFPSLMKSESTLKILYTREDSVSREQSEISPCGSLSRTFEPQHSLQTSSLSQSKTNIPGHPQLLKELQAKIAGKLLRNQIPHNVPPPLGSGLVLKYPICLQCGLCSGLHCYHKLQSAFGPYILIYPQLHLLSNSEGYGEVRLHLGFRLQTLKRSQDSKYHRRNRADPWKGITSPPRRKARFSTPASKSPSPRRDFQSRSSLSPASVEVHTQQKQWHSHGVTGKTTAEDYEFYQVHSVSENDYESNQDEKSIKSSLRKTSALTYSVKNISKGPKTENTRLYKVSTSTEDSCPRTPRGLSRNRIETTQTSIVSSKRQPKKSSQPKFIQRLFHHLRQTFQAVRRSVSFSRQKFEYKRRPDCDWLMGSRTPAVRHRSTSSTPTQKDKLQGSSESCRQAEQPKLSNSLLPRPLQLQKSMICGRDVFHQATPVPEPSKRVPNLYSIAKKKYTDKISSQELKKYEKVGAKFQAQETIESKPLLTGFLQRPFAKKINREEQGLFREATLCNKPCERTHCRLPQRTHQRGLSKRRHHSPQRRYSSPSDTTLRSLSEKSHHSPSQRSSLSSSLRRNPRSPSRTSPQILSRRSPCSPSRRNLCSSSSTNPQNPSGSSHHSPLGSSLKSTSGRSSHIPLRSPHSPWRRCPCSPWRIPCSLLRSSHSPSRRSPRSPSRRSPRSPSRRNLHIPSSRSPQNCSWSSHHSPSRSSLQRPSGWSPSSSSGRSPY